VCTKLSEMTHNWSSHFNFYIYLFLLNFGFAFFDVLFIVIVNMLLLSYLLTKVFSI